MAAGSSPPSLSLRSAAGSPISRSGFFSTSWATKSPSSRLVYCSSLIACCSCGVITRVWLCFSSSRGDSAMGILLPAEAFAEIDPAHVLIGHDLAGAAFHQHLAVMDDEGPVDDIQRLAHVMIGDQHAETAILQ